MQTFSEGFCVNVGNPHIIFFDKDYLKHDLRVIGPKIENHNLFPEKTNVTFANVIDKKSEFHNKTVDILIKNGIISNIDINIKNSKNYKELKFNNLSISPGWFDYMR